MAEDKPRSDDKAKPKSQSNSANARDLSDGVPDTKQAPKVGF